MDSLEQDGGLVPVWQILPVSPPPPQHTHQISLLFSSVTDLRGFMVTKSPGLKSLSLASHASRSDHLMFSRPLDFSGTGRGKRTADGSRREEGGAGRRDTGR